MRSAADAIRLSSSEMNNAFVSAFARPPQDLGMPSSLDISPEFENIPSPNEPNELSVKAEHESPMLHHSSTQLSSGSLVSPPDSTGDDVNFTGMSNNTLKPATSPDGSDISPGHKGTDFNTPPSASRHSSRQPKIVDRFVPETFMPKGHSGQSTKQERRASSSASSALTAVTDASRRLSSNTSGMVDGFVAPASQISIEVKPLNERAGSTDSVAVIDDADERLARELHAQENGLRRRSTRA